MAPNRKVLDLSHHNTVLSFTAVKDAGIVGVIHKATEGTGYVDPNYAGRKIEFVKAGLLWGAYHFVHPGNISAQVDKFLSVTGIDPNMLYALDWEASTTGTANEADAVRFLQLLEQKTGRKGVVYSGNVAKEQIHGNNTYIGSHRLWLAQYSTATKVQRSWKAWWLWQYSDGKNGPQPHGCPGVSGDVDTNAWAGTDAELRQQWSGTGSFVIKDVNAPVAPVTPPGPQVAVGPGPVRFQGFCIRGLLSVFLSRAMENLTAEINAKYPRTMQVSDHGYWFSAFSNVGWLTRSSAAIHNAGKKIVLIGHSFGATAAIMAAQNLNHQGIAVDLLCPIDPAVQYTTTIPTNVKRIVAFYQTEPGQLGQGVIKAGPGWLQANWSSRAVDYHRTESHLSIANDPFVHAKILEAIKELT